RHRCRRACRREGACRWRRLGDAGPADDRARARCDHRAARAGDGVGREQHREIGAGAVPHHRYRPRRDRGYDRQFCDAVRSGQEFSMRNPSHAPRPLTGRMVLFYLLAFFGTVIGVNMLMMKFAIDTLPGTEVDSAYRASLAYESEIAAARDQNRRNWKVDAHVERRADGAATVRLDARDANGT